MEDWWKKAEQWKADAEKWRHETEKTRQEFEGIQPKRVLSLKMTDSVATILRDNRSRQMGENARRTSKPP